MLVSAQRQLHEIQWPVTRVSNVSRAPGQIQATEQVAGWVVQQVPAGWVGLSAQLLLTILYADGHIQQRPRLFQRPCAQIPQPASNLVGWTSEEGEGALQVVSGLQAICLTPLAYDMPWTRWFNCSCGLKLYEPQKF